MRTFDEYMGLKAAEPRVFQAARLMRDLGINPEEYLRSLAEAAFANPYLNRATDHLADLGYHGARAGMGAVGAAGNLAMGGATTAWDVGSRAAKDAIQGAKDSAVGQGVKNWWQDFTSPDRKLVKAAALIQKAMSDPVVVGLNDGGDKTVLDKMLADLTSIAAAAREARKNPAAGWSGFEPE